METLFPTSGRSPTLELGPGAPAYPSPLAAWTRPPTLRVRGALPSAPGVAIVGRRRASSGAVAHTRHLVELLGGAGLSIWSGGALGVDAAAHEAAIDVGAPTVVVLGGGLDRPYPKENAGLFDRVLDAGGALVSRVADDAPPLRQYFLARNEILAALTGATLVVEAGVPSGALSTARFARALDRPLFVVPHAPWDPAGHGCLALLSQGARLLIDPADILAALGRAVPRPAVPTCPIAEPEDPDELAVAAVLGAAPLHIDVICARTGLSAGRVGAAILTLSIKGWVLEDGAGAFVRRG